MRGVSDLVALARSRPRSWKARWAPVQISSCCHCRASASGSASVGSAFDLIKRVTQCGLEFVELLPTTGGLDTVVGQCITPSHEDFASSVVGDAQLGQVR